MQEDVNIIELRVGNILTLGDEYVRVIFNDEKGNYRVADFDNPNSIPNPMCVKEAIILNQEILEYCGFTRQDESGDFWHSPRFFIRVFENRWVRWEKGDLFTDRRIMYLHELQNLYSDTLHRELQITRLPNLI